MLVLTRSKFYTCQNNIAIQETYIILFYSAGDVLLMPKIKK